MCEFVWLLWFHVHLWKEGNGRNPSLLIVLVFFFLAKGIEGCKVRFLFHFLPHRRKGMEGELTFPKHPFLYVTIGFPDSMLQ